MDISLGHITEIFGQFISSGSNQFYKDIMERAQEKMELCHGVDLELLHLSNTALEKARKQKEDCNEWFHLSIILRRIAHKIHRKCPVPSIYNGFLELIRRF